MTPSVSDHTAVSEEGRGQHTRIPMRNIWLLLLYASKLFRTLDRGAVSIEDNPDDIPDLVAEMLCYHVEQRLRHNLSFGHHLKEAHLGRVRGRIDLLTTETHQLLARGRVACQFNELTLNTPRNRYVRSALESIAARVRRSDLAHRCRTHALRLKRMGVTGSCPDRRAITNERYGRHDANDRPMVSVAQLAFDLALPTEAAGTMSLGLPSRDDAWLRRLFEQAVAGFYRVVLSPQGWQVKSSKPLFWQRATETQGIDRILPSMVVDMELEHPASDRRVVIDTKFNEAVTRGWHREKTLRSSYLYQIYAYVRSQERENDLVSWKTSGLLLHPAVGEMWNEAVVIQGHEFRFATVDLAASAKEIRAQLLNVIERISRPS